MKRKIGIDAGGSLVKIAYEEGGHFHLKTFLNEELEHVLQWLKITARRAELYLTGGKSGHYKGMVTQKTYEIEEFAALAEGTRYLLNREHGITDEAFVLVSIGTGTSIFYVTEQSFERLLGTGIGGGTFMGIGALLTGKSDFHELVAMAANGDRGKSDLLVKDIYAPNEPPLPGEMTAANFGKAHLQKDASKSDYMASLTQLIGETILLFATQAAIARNVQKIVFVGSTLHNNALKTLLTSFSGMLPYEAIFLEKGSHAGAIGALLYNS